VGAALADDIRQCDGLVDILSYWTFDDVFEENGVVRQPFMAASARLPPEASRSHLFTPTRFYTNWEKSALQMTRTFSSPGEKAGRW
jgi:hypothetical protein